MCLRERNTSTYPGLASTAPNFEIAIFGLRSVVLEIGDKDNSSKTRCMPEKLVPPKVAWGLSPYVRLRVNPAGLYSTPCVPRFLENYIDRQIYIALHRWSAPHAHSTTTI